MVYLLFNPLANSGNGEKTKNEVKPSLEEKFGKITEQDVTKLKAEEFLKGLKGDDRVILLGGDGTLMHLANSLKGLKLICFSSSLMLQHSVIKYFLKE